MPEADPPIDAEDDQDAEGDACAQDGGCEAGEPNTAGGDPAPFEDAGPD